MERRRDKPAGAARVLAVCCMRGAANAGHPFSALRQDARLALARCLLARGESVKHAALEAGFSDPAYFTRVFTRRHGVPPSRWRARPD